MPFLLHTLTARGHYAPSLVIDSVGPNGSGGPVLDAFDRRAKALGRLVIRVLAESEAMEPLDVLAERYPVPVLAGTVKTVGETVDA